MNFLRENLSHICLYIFHGMECSISHTVSAQKKKNFSWIINPVIYFCYKYSLVSWANLILLLTKFFLHGDPKRNRSKQKTLDFPCKRRAKPEYVYTFENRPPSRFQKYEAFEFTSISSQHHLLRRGRKECQDAWDEIQKQEIERDEEEGKETTYSRSPSYEPSTLHHTSNSLTISPLNCNPKHTENMISFSLITDPPS